MPLAQPKELLEWWKARVPEGFELESFIGQTQAVVLAPAPERARFVIYGSICTPRTLPPPETEMAKGPPPPRPEPTPVPMQGYSSPPPGPRSAPVQRTLSPGPSSFWAVRPGTLVCVAIAAFVLGIIVAPYVPGGH